MAAHSASSNAPALISAEPRGPASSAILLVFFPFAVGTIINWGSFSWQGLALVVAAMALAILFHLRLSPRLPPDELLLTVVLVVCLVAGLVLAAGQGERKVMYLVPGLPTPKWRLNGFGMALKLVSAAAFLIGLAWLTALPRRFERLAFGALVCAAAAMRLLMLFSTPAPVEDVFVCQTEGARATIERHANVYEERFQSPYPAPPADAEEAAAMAGRPIKPSADTFAYPYPPTSFYPALLSWALFKDVRAGWLLCDLIAAFLLYRLAGLCQPGAGRARFRRMLVLTFLFLPRALFVLEQSFTEPIILVSLAGLALALSSGAGSWRAGLWLGVWLTSKQYVLIVAPLLLKLRRCAPRIWGAGLIVAAVLIAPYAAWNFHALWENAVIFFLKVAPRQDALSLYGAMTRSGREIPAAALLIAWLAGLAFFAWRMRRSVAGWLFSAASLWMWFFLFGKQACVNYFHLIAFTLLLAVAACEPPPAARKE